MQLEILDHAERDLESGFHFYEKQRSGLGDYFLHSLYGEIDSLIIFGGIHPVVFGYHRLLSHNFPFAVYYLLHDDVVEVWAVVDCRRNPTRMKQKLKKLKKVMKR